MFSRSIPTSFLRDNAPWLSAGVLLTLLSSFGQTFFISIFAGHIRADFGLSHGDWGLIYSLGTTASAAVMIWAGSLADIYRVRSLGQAVLIALAAACCFMAVNTWVVLLPLVIFCLRLTGQGMASHIAVVAMGRWFVATRGSALAVAALGFSVGEAVLPIAFVALLTFLDWRVAWLLAAVIALAAIPLLRGYLKTERQPNAADDTTQSTGMQNRHWTRMEALRHPLLWLMVPALLGPSAFNTAFFFHQVHFAEIKGMSHLALVSLFPVYTIVSILAMIASGIALDRYGTARLLPWGQVPMMLAFFCFAFGTSLSTFVAGFVFLAMTTGANSTLPNAFWAEFYGTRHLGSIKAMATAIMVFGSAVGPGVTGYLIDVGVGLDTQYIAIGLYFLIPTLCTWIGVTRFGPR